MVSRLTQSATPGRAYEDPTDVDISQASWGWTAYPVTVAYETPAVSRLSQIGVSAAADPTEEAAVIGPTTVYWGWTAYPVTVDFEDPQIVDIIVANWGWAPQNVTICSRYDRGYFGSFNGNVWPSCAWNDHVFGPRTHLNIKAGGTSWGWQPNPVTVTFSDPVDVDIGVGNWGWFAYPMAVSVGLYSVLLMIVPAGAQSSPSLDRSSSTVSLLKSLAT